MISITNGVSERARVVVIATDVVGTHMAGPGIRAVRIAEQLADVAVVTLAVNAGSAASVGLLSAAPYAVRTYGDANELVRIIGEHDVAYSQVLDPDVIRRGGDLGTRLVFDLYNALPAEAIGAEKIGGSAAETEKDRVFAEVLNQFRVALRAGAYFVTSNDRQRDFWIGYALASNALRPSTLRGRVVEDVIGLVPFGMQDGEPVARRSALREDLGIPAEEFLLVWAGGIWDWFDAETPIRAIAELRGQGRPVSLAFYGTAHPNDLIGTPPAVERAQSLARRLGVLGDGVYFADGWVAADDRADYLLDADAAVSAHRPSFETRYAFRTRILDHFWARLPSIVTDGDWFAEYIRDHQLGTVVPCEDVDAMMDAIAQMSHRRHRRRVQRRIDAIRDEWRWSVTTRPLRHAVATWEASLVPGDPGEPTDPSAG
ncbi:MAG: glycosyltransferase [Microbacterium sp.]|uniref:glycosyltransferase n=1 Tax=Microbacterium sp. TaxID=51671 RepID=UPI0026000E66|nr:glycosyltransferase [Microbacterium sp.]MBQ9915973.1 glycosyltransferase [Microbacterium sp.]